ncbi:MAG TPA: MG2 domain-containing protein [Gemmataceae bacterium]|nr:MG2 domain-containing protein [Gemmataceae bacterium]
MYTCDHFRERIWDDLFGLLEADDRGNLQLHLATCSTCQAELATARAQHQLVAEAARLDVEIPPFVAPERERAQPISRPARPQSGWAKSRSQMMPWLATAAAVLLLIGLPVGLYVDGRWNRTEAWHAAEAAVARIVVQRQALQTQAQLERDNLISTTRAKHLRLQVLGPAAYQLAAANPYRVWITDVAGQPVDVPVAARLLESDKSEVLQTKKAAGKGEWIVELPAYLPLMPEQTPRLELAVRDQTDPAPVRTYLRVLEPAYRTHLATDQSVYQGGDTIYFRSVTLERFGQKIAEREFTATFTLTDAQGNVVQTLGGLTNHGAGSGAFEISPNWSAGAYSLTVAEANKRFPPVTRRLWIGPVSAGGQVNTHLSGSATPATANTLAVEFFPEGGDLLAGVENRVYFRVRTLSGQQADLQAVLLDSHDREVAQLQTTDLKNSAPIRGLGVFTLRPQAAESYHVRARSPRGVTVRAKLPAIQTTGLALSLPKAVLAPEESLRVVLHATGPQRQVILGLFCQGRLIAQDLVVAKPGTSEVRLTPTVPCSGILRVTVFEERDGQLAPLAERLAFARPQQRLALSVQADKASYAPGEKAQLQLRSLDEKGRPQSSWLLVSVVEQTALSHNELPHPTLSAYFTLTSELQRPEDLEEAEVLLGDTPEAARGLDLFLGTQGWRRFVEPEDQAVLVQRNAATKRIASDPLVPAIIKLDNGEQVEHSYTAELSQALATVEAGIAKRDQELIREGNERLQTAQAAAQDLEAYTTRAKELFHQSIGLGALVLLAVGSLLLLISLLRLARGLSYSRPYLASAFVALLLCVVMLWGPTNGWAPSAASTDSPRMKGYAQSLAKEVEFPAFATQTNLQGPPSRLASKGWSPTPESSEKALGAFPLGQAAGALDRTGTTGTGAPRGPGIMMIRPISPSLPIPSGPKKAGSETPLRVRAYAYEASTGAVSGRPIPETILWQPILFAEGGKAEVRFALPPKAATYRIQVQAHDANGRLGASQQMLECR